MNDIKFKDIEQVQSKLQELDFNSKEFGSKISQYVAKKKSRIFSKSQMKIETEEDPEGEEDFQQLEKPTTPRFPSILVIDLEQIKTNNNELNLSLINDVFFRVFTNCDKIDFSGLESATDLLFYVFKTNLKSFPIDEKNKLNNCINNSCFIGCKYITIFGLYHYFSAIGKSIFDFNEDFDVK